MQLGMVGLGRMGGNMTKRLEAAGHEVKTFDTQVEATASSLEELAQQLDAPRSVWLMVPAGIVDNVVSELAPHLEEGDTIVDGGNSYYVDDLRRAKELRERGLHYVDVGVSGGVWGRERGYCLMVGGDDEAVGRLVPVFETLAPGVDTAGRTSGREGDPAPEELGWLHCGANGAGHFVKMVHNGIEYGLMQAYAEGFEVMKAQPDFELDLHEIAGIWRYGSVVRSWLLELLHAAFEKEGSQLEKIHGYVEDSGEGRWTIAEAIAEDVPVPVISAALYARFASRQEESFAAKVTAALRNQFGGHAVKAVEAAKATPQDPR
jgi:6-phosphogluconate dehydrogenase